jgi:hypothetical protein
MKVDNLLFFNSIMLKFTKPITSYNAIDIFENLTMNRGGLTWVEMF